MDLLAEIARLQAHNKLLTESLAQERRQRKGAQEDWLEMKGERDRLRELCGGGPPRMATARCLGCAGVISIPMLCAECHEANPLKCGNCAEAHASGLPGCARHYQMTIVSQSPMYEPPKSRGQDAGPICSTPGCLNPYQRHDPSKCYTVKK